MYVNININNKQNAICNILNRKTTDTEHHTFTSRDLLTTTTML